MAKFKVGDEVRVVANGHDIGLTHADKDSVGKIFTIKEIRGISEDGQWYYVRENIYGWTEDKFELVTPHLKRKEIKKVLKRMFHNCIMGTTIRTELKDLIEKI
jgi:hypothetical protein